MSLLREAAYHEAGHVVVAYALGWWVNEGVTIREEGSGYTGLRCDVYDNTPWKGVQVDCAGWQAECRWRRHSGRVHRSTLQAAIDRARDRAPIDIDLDHAIGRLILNDEDFGLTDDQVIGAFREREARALDLVDKGWLYIKALVPVLLRQPTTPRETIEMVLRSEITRHDDATKAGQAR